MASKKKSDTRPLAQYIREQRALDRKIFSMLSQAAGDIEKQLLAMAGKDGIGAVIRREQLTAVKKAIHEAQAELMRNIGLEVRAAEFTAAAAAIDTFAMYDAMLMTALPEEFKDAYLASAQLTARQGLESAKKRLLGDSYIPLADSVYNTTALVNGQVDRYVNSALARGLSWKELADGVRGMIRPDVPGGTAYAAKRLGRTEINNAFHATAKQKAIDTPWVIAVDWQLSGSHPVPDECNTNAEEVHFEGGEPGWYLPEDVPGKPHPQCLCFVTPVSVGEDEFIDSYFAGKYDPHIDQIMRDAGYSDEFIAAGKLPLKQAAKVDDARSLGASIQPTAENIADMRKSSITGKYIDADGNFTEERKQLHDAIVKKHLQGVTPVDKPTQWMNGGGPASGKSSLTKGVNKTLTGYSDNAVLLDPDEVKLMLPESQVSLQKLKAGRGSLLDVEWAAESHEESSYLAKRIHQAALDARLNVIYDGTGDGGVSSVRKKIQQARDFGYNVESNYLYLDPTEGLSRALKREAETFRKVPPTVITHTYSNIAEIFPDIVNGDFDMIRLFDNNQSNGEIAKLIFESNHGQITIHDPAAYARFLQGTGV